MHVKNHMAMWSLWFLWFLCVEYSGNHLYKPLCAFLVFVDLVWFLCGSCVGRFVVFGHAWFLALVCASYCSLWFLRIGGLAIDADGCASDRAHVVFVARWSCPN